jgi:hypothetical protein
VHGGSASVGAGRHSNFGGGDDRDIVLFDRRAGGMVIMTAFWSFQSPFFTSNDSCNPRGNILMRGIRPRIICHIPQRAHTHTLHSTERESARRGEKRNNDLKHDYGVAINGRCSGLAVGYLYMSMGMD